MISFGRPPTLHFVHFKGANSLSGSETSHFLRDWTKLTVSPLLAEVPERNPHLAGFVSQIVLDTGARKYNQTYWQSFEHPVVALEWSSLFVSVPVRPEGDLWNLARVGPASGSAFGTGGRCSMQKDHVGMTPMNPVEDVPDGRVIVAIGATCEGNAGAFGQQHTGILSGAFVEEVAAVDDG